MDKVITQAYYKYADGLVSKSQIDDNAKVFQKEMDNWYKRFVEMKVEIGGKTYTVKNNKVEFGGKTYRMNNGVIEIDGNIFTPVSSDIQYNDLPLSAQHKVDMMIARAKLYQESKSLSDKIINFAIKTNSPFPPHEEVYDGEYYAETDENVRIGTFLGFLKKKFDYKADIDYTHSMLNTYGLLKLVEYKSEIVNNLYLDNQFDYDTLDATQYSSQQHRLECMADNSEILKKYIIRAAKALDIDYDKIGKYGTNISGETARGYLLQISQMHGDEIIDKCKDNAINYLTAMTKANLSAPQTSQDNFADTIMSDTIYFDKEGYTVRKDNKGNWINTNTGQQYSGNVYLEDGCPVYDPVEEFREYKRSSSGQTKTTSLHTKSNDNTHEK